MSIYTNSKIDEITLNNLMSMHGMDRIRLAYDGEITIGNVESILELLNNGFEKWQSTKGSGRALRIAVEILQNVAKHTLEAGKENSYVMLFTSDTKLFMVTCNRVSASDKSIIENTFEDVKDFSVDQLREKYRQALTDSTFNEKGGAGIGLLDIAYRTKKVPDHSFVQVANTTSYDFIMKVNLNLD